MSSSGMLRSFAKYSLGLKGRIIIVYLTLCCVRRTQRNDAAFLGARRVDNHHHSAVQLAEHHEPRLFDASPARVLPPHERTAKYNSCSFKDKIAIGEGSEALRSVPFKVIVAIGRDPWPEDR